MMKLKNRDGWWHVHGTTRNTKGEIVTIRRSTGLPATKEYRKAAQTRLAELERSGKYTRRPGKIREFQRSWETAKTPGRADAGNIQMFVDTFGDRRPDDVSPSEYRAFLQANFARPKTDAKAATMRRRRDSVSSFMRHVHEETKGDIDSDTMSMFTKLDLPQADNFRTYFLDADTRDRFVAAFPSQYRGAVGFMFHTGCRFSEMARLKWRDVDEPMGVVTFKNRKNRARIWRERTVPVSERAMSFLPVRRADNDTVFGDMPHRQLYRAHRSVCVSLGVDPPDVRFRIHDYRHTFATLSHHGGMDIANVAALIGDTVQTTIERYVHQTPWSLGKALAGVAGPVRAAPTGTVIGRGVT